MGEMTEPYNFGLPRSPALETKASTLPNVLAVAPQPVATKQEERFRFGMEWSPALTETKAKTSKEDRDAEDEPETKAFQARLHGAVFHTAHNLKVGKVVKQAQDLLKAAHGEAVKESHDLSVPLLHEVMSGLSAYHDGVEVNPHHHAGHAAKLAHLAHKMSVLVRRHSLPTKTLEGLHEAAHHIHTAREHHRDAAHHSNEEQMRIQGRLEQERMKHEADLLLHEKETSKQKVREEAEHRAEIWGAAWHGGKKPKGEAANPVGALVQADTMPNKEPEAEVDHTKWPFRGKEKKSRFDFMEVKATAHKPDGPGGGQFTSGPQVASAPAPDAPTPEPAAPAVSAPATPAAPTADAWSGKYTPDLIAHAKTVYDKAVKAEPAVTKMMQEMAKKHGMRLDGLDYRIKGQESLARKIDDDARRSGIADPATANATAAAGCSDSVRYTGVVEPEHYTEAVKNTLDEFKKQGYGVRTKNYWAEGDPYQGMNVALTHPDGTQIELQFHTQESLDDKMVSHHDYETYRSSKSDKERRALWDKMTVHAATLKVPPDIIKYGSLKTQEYKPGEEKAWVWWK